jgi:hypothetical protein
MNQMMENKQALFCPLEQNIQKLGTILSITPKVVKPVIERTINKITAPSQPTEKTI